MDDLWQQFHRLPKAIRDAVATRQALAAVERLEQANPGLDLADFVMRLMVKEFPISELPEKIEAETKLTPDKSQIVAKQLQTDVLASVTDYLGIQTGESQPDKKASSKKGQPPMHLPVSETKAIPPRPPAAPPSIAPNPAVSIPTPRIQNPSLAESLSRDYRGKGSEPQRGKGGLAPSQFPPTPPVRPLGQPIAQVPKPIAPIPPVVPPSRPPHVPLGSAMGPGPKVPPPVRTMLPPAPPKPAPPSVLPPTPVSTGLGQPAAQPLSLSTPKPVQPTPPVPPPLRPPQGRGGLGQPLYPRISMLTPTPGPTITPSKLSPTMTPSPVVPISPSPLVTVPAPAVPAAMPPRPAMAEPPKTVASVAPTQEYSEEESREIEQQAAHVKTLQAAASIADFDELAKRILDQHHLAWPEELMTKRAQAIAKARLKEIRNSAQTELMLTREPKVGGLGLDPELAKQLTTDLGIEAGQLKAKGMVRPPEPVQPPPPVAAPPVQEARPIGLPPLTRVIPPTGLPLAKTPAVTIVDVPRQSRPIKRPADIPAPMTTPSAIATPAPPPQPVPTVMQRPREPDRTIVSDISRPKKTFGPGDEMRSLTLTEWRRLGQGAAESARVILEKFKHLQRESFPLWTAALTGWRQSEVYQLYLDMGRQSLDQGMTIQDVIALRARNGETYLSEHEFFTVTDLNRMLQH